MNKDDVAHSAAQKNQQSEEELPNTIEAEISGDVGSGSLSDEENYELDTTNVEDVYNRIILPLIKVSNMSKEEGIFMLRLIMCLNVTTEHGTNNCVWIGSFESIFLRFLHSAPIYDCFSNFLWSVAG